MLAKTAKHWLGFVAILALDIGATAPAEAASPTPISACPYTITAPGNYVVTRNLTATGTCIKFAAPVDNVALDLQGHGITGNGTGYGIVCLQNPSGGRCNRVVIANGAVTRFSGVSDSRSNSNGSHAITASGEVSNSTANNNGGYGISGVIVTDSTAKGNALGGIIVSSGNPSNYASVVDSNASGNSGDGIQSR